MNKEKCDGCKWYDKDYYYKECDNCKRKNRLDKWEKRQND